MLLVCLFLFVLKFLLPFVFIFHHIRWFFGLSFITGCFYCNIEMVLPTIVFFFFLQQGLDGFRGMSPFD